MSTSPAPRPHTTTPSNPSHTSPLPHTNSRDDDTAFPRPTAASANTSAANAPPSAPAAPSVRSSSHTSNIDTLATIALATSPTFSQLPYDDNRSTTTINTAPMLSPLDRNADMPPPPRHQAHTTSPNVGVNVTASATASEQPPLKRPRTDPEDPVVSVPVTAPAATATSVALARPEHRRSATVTVSTSDTDDSGIASRDSSSSSSGANTINTNTTATEADRKDSNNSGNNNNNSMKTDAELLLNFARPANTTPSQSVFTKPFPSPSLALAEPLGRGPDTSAAPHMRDPYVNVNTTPHATVSVRDYSEYEHRRHSLHAYREEAASPYYVYQQTSPAMPSYTPSPYAPAGSAGSLGRPQPPQPYAGGGRDGSGLGFHNDLA
ncbi:hypothetical protein KEM55_008605, partial [Ascosphaera atra]